jgi:hypothetical protein
MNALQLFNIESGNGTLAIVQGLPQGACIGQFDQRRHVHLEFPVPRMGRDQ